MVASGKSLLPKLAGIIERRSHVSGSDMAAHLSGRQFMDKKQA